MVPPKKKKRMKNLLAKATQIEGSAPIGVYDHCVHTGLVADHLQQLTPIHESAAIIAALHDIGKINPEFQARIRGEKSIPGLHKNHALVSAAAVNRFTGGSLAADIVGAHHGVPVLSPPHDRGARFGGPDWAEKRQEMINALINKFGPIPDIDRDSMGSITGLVTVADWIASGAPDVLAADAVSQAGFEKVEVASDLSFADIFRFEPNTMQMDISKMVDQSGVYVIESATGSGKTEAALYAAYKLLVAAQARGLYFALPTMATANAMLSRVESFVERIAGRGTRLMHSMAWNHGAGGGELAPGGSWFNPKKRGLLYPFAVGTIDQALLAAMRVKHYTVRQYGLAGKVVIIDELHSFDAYTGALVNALTRQVVNQGGTVLVLSATLTDAVANGILSTADQRVRIQVPAKTDHQVDLVFTPDDMGRMAEEAFSSAAGGACVGVIVNTVTRAQDMFRLVQAQGDNVPVGLLHSRFTAGDRNRLERHWLDALGPDGQRPRGCVLIGTQVLEQSLDVDFDLIFSDLAPVDLLIQRAGRLWRHERQQRPINGRQMVIIDTMPAFSVYPVSVLWRTRQAIDAGRITLPADTMRLLSRVYERQDDAPDWVKDAELELDADILAMKQLALGASVDARMPPLSDDVVATRLGIESVLMAVGSDEPDNLVRVPRSWMPEGVTFGGLRYADLLLPNDAGLAYSPELGLYRITNG